LQSMWFEPFVFFLNREIQPGEQRREAVLVGNRREQLGGVGEDVRRALAHRQLDIAQNRLFGEPEADGS
jgi:hypothetical protein